jgi:hypothetical protein
MENMTNLLVHTYEKSSLAQNGSSSTILAIAIGFYVFSFAWSKIFGYKVSVFGIKSAWEPIVVSNFRFFLHAEEVLLEGYRAVSHLPSSLKQRLTVWTSVQG